MFNYGKCSRDVDKWWQVEIIIPPYSLHAFSVLALFQLLSFYCSVINLDTRMPETFD